MSESTFSSPKIAKEMETIFGSSSKDAKIKLYHEKEIKKFVLQIEKGHQKAAKSKLQFR